MEPVIKNYRKNPEYSAFLADFQKANPDAPKLSSSDPALIAEHVVKHASDGKAREWLGQLFASNGSEESKRSLPIGFIALGVGGMAIAAFLAYGIFYNDFLTDVAKPNVARGLVTFLFAFATIAVFVISSIAIFWADYEEVEKRAGLAKELIAVMIGVLGTILGFYFGSAEIDATPAAPAEVSSQDTDGQASGQ